jgi:hypothetical protein
MSKSFLSTAPELTERQWAETPQHGSENPSRQLDAKTTSIPISRLARQNRLFLSIAHAKHAIFPGETPDLPGVTDDCPRVDGKV